MRLLNTHTPAKVASGIRRLLRAAFPQDTVEVLPNAPLGVLKIIVVSHVFDGMGAAARERHILGIVGPVPVRHRLILVSPGDILAVNGVALRFRPPKGTI